MARGPGPGPRNQYAKPLWKFALLGKGAKRVKFTPSGSVWPVSISVLLQPSTKLNLRPEFSGIVFGFVGSRSVVYIDIAFVDGKHCFLDSSMQNHAEP